MNKPEQIKPEKMDLKSMDIAAEKREELKRLLGETFPDAFSEGAIDFDRLKRVLGEWVEPTKERFGLNWAGKAECMRIIQQPSGATLKPLLHESLDFEGTENLFIEGDNLEVLKLMQKAYFNKIKMIYIDPPYNTGNEFIYPDNYSETLETYLAYTGQVDDEGRKFSTSTEAAGRFHSRWLNMLYPRLYLARNLLRDDGLIFVSIDDNELGNLRHLLDEIFGEENFVDCIVWKKRYGGGAKEKYLVSMHEYILIYAKDLYALPEIFVPLQKGQIERYYTNRDKHFEKRGPYRTHPLEAMKSFDTRENLKFAIPAPDGTEVWPKRQWRWSKERAAQALKSDEIEFQRGRSGDWILSSKQYLKNDKGDIRQTKAFSVIDDVFSQHGTNEIVDIFGDAKIFDFPKPSGLLQHLLKIGTIADGNDMVLDFFAGSNSTGHAVFAQNEADNGNRRFIAVQLPEKCDPESQAFRAGLKNIAQIGRERTRKVAHAIEGKDANSLKFKKANRSDLGFRAYSLGASNFRAWNSEDVEHLEAQLEMHVEHIASASTPEDLLYELLLKAGFPLTTRVTKIQIAGKSIFSVQEGSVLICLDKEITPELIDALAEANPLQVICLDAGFKGNDQLKTNAVQTFKAQAQAEESEIVFKTV